MPYKDKEIQRAYQRDWARKHKIVLTEEQKESRKRQRHALQQWFVDLKKTLKCDICGESRWFCLDFHHIDGKVDIRNGIARMVKDRRSKIAIEKEIEKCQVLCANCHREVHYAKDV